MTAARCTDTKGELAVASLSFGLGKVGSSVTDKLLVRRGALVGARSGGAELSEVSLRGSE